MSKVVHLFFFLLIFFTHFASYAQERPVYSHYWLNPYFINPSLVSKADQIEVHAGHRQQWVGIADAPAVSYINFHMPLDQKMSFGVNIYNFKRGLLSTNNILLSFGYNARFGTSHGLRFGISGGIGNNSFDLDRADNPNDPALANVPLNSMYLDGQFGVTYYLEKFSIGVALTELFEKELLQDESFGSIANDPLKNFTVNARYKFQKKNTQVGVEPFLLYEVNKEQSNYFEAGSLLHFYEAFHVGGSYRQYYGPTVYTGYSFLEKFTVGYAYELATQQKLGMGRGTHELHIAMFLDKKQKVELPKKKIEKEIVKTEKKDDAVESEPKSGKGYHDQEYLELKDDTLNILKPKYSDVTILQKGNHPEELAVGSYVVSATFSSVKLANKQKKVLSKEGYDANTGYSSETKQYYLYLFRSEDVQSARQQQQKLRRSRLFKDVWLIKVE